MNYEIKIHIDELTLKRLLKGKPFSGELPCDITITNNDRTGAIEAHQKKLVNRQTKKKWETNQDLVEIIKL